MSSAMTRCVRDRASICGPQASSRIPHAMHEDERLARAGLVESGAARLLDRCGVGDIVAQILEVLITVADAVVRTPAHGRAERDENFRCRRASGTEV